MAALESMGGYYPERCSGHCNRLATCSLDHLVGHSVVHCTGWTAATRIIVELAGAQGAAFPSPPCEQPQQNKLLFRDSCSGWGLASRLPSMIA